MFFREYLRILIPLGILAALYGKFVVPILEPVHPKKDPLKSIMIADDQPKWWTHFFTEGSWQSKSPKVLETEQGIMLFDNWERLSPDRWRLSPLTILIPQDSSSSTDGKADSERRAIFVENPDGAEIQFQDAIDWTSGKPPPVIGGQLNGPIRIYAPPRNKSSADGMLIDTKDLRIDRRHIWTTKNVNMKLGRSTIEGHDLSIYLDQDLLSSKDQTPTTTESPFSGFDHLELIYIDRVEIDLPPKGLFAKQDRNGDEAGHITTMENLPRAKAEVFCNKAFHFDFHQSMATLSGDVLLRQIIPGEQEDTFQAEKLNLHFAWNKPTDEVVDAIKTASGSRGGEWSIDRIEAAGSTGHDPNDISRWVRLEAPSVKSRGQGRWLRMDMKEGRIALSNHLPGSIPTDSAQVYLERDGMKVWSPDIEYASERIKESVGSPQDTDSDKDSNIPNKPMRLGTLWAAGPGQAAVQAEDGDQWRLSWAKSLQLQPDGELDLLTIEGSANARSQAQGRFSAETVRLWLSGITEEVADEVMVTTQSKSPSTVLAKKLNAVGQVIVNAPSLRAQVNDMTIWFEYPEIDRAIESIASQQSLSFDERKRRRESRQLIAASQSANRISQPANSNPIGRDSTSSIAASPIGSAFSGLAQIAGQIAGPSPTSNVNPIDRQSVPKLTSIAGQSVTQSADNYSGSDNLGSNNTGVGQLAASSLRLPGSGENPLSIDSLPMNVTGEKLLAKLVQQPQGMAIEDLSLSGIVTITRNQISPDSPLPLTITGTELRLDNSENGQLDGYLLGNPASIAIGSGAMEGPEIRFNERMQMVWIDQPGIFRLPPEAMNDLSPQKTTTPDTLTNRFTNPPQLLPNSNSLEETMRWIEPPEVAWSGRMIFQGKTATMDGGVKISGRVQTDAQTIWHLHGESESMVVQLKQPVAIGTQATHPNQNGKTEVETIELRNSVDIKAAQTDLQGQRRSLEHIQVPSLTFRVPQMQVLGTGPGSLRSRRLGNSKGTDVFQGQQPPPTVLPTKDLSLQCLHLTFLGKMQGDFNARQVDFYDQVETLLGTILNWEQELDVRRVDRIEIGQTMMTCDQMSIFDTNQLSYNRGQSSDAAWEVTGAGRVRVNGNNEKGQFVVLANRVSYAALYNVLRLEGTPQSPAIMKRLDSNAAPGSTPTEVRLSSGSINLKTGVSQSSISSFTADLTNLKGNNIQAPLNPNQNNWNQPAPVNPNALQSPRDTNLFNRGR